MRFWFAMGLVGLVVGIGTAMAEDSSSPKERGYFGYVATYEAEPSGDGRIHVLEVHDDGPAKSVGLRPGDRIHRLNGEAFAFDNDLDMIRQLTSLSPGETITLEWTRDGEALRGVLTVGRQPEQKKQDLGQWMARAEVWFEQGGEEHCKLTQEQQKIYRDLETRVAGKNLLVTMRRPQDPRQPVSYSTTDGETLALERLQNTFLDALAMELPAGHSWALSIRKEDGGISGAVLVAVPQEGPRTGQRGLLVNRGLLKQSTASAE
jgi:membrane-associated protease RseP (regulator of RpoE activity)